MQIKTTMRYHFIPARVAIIKKSTKTVNTREGVEKREPSCTTGGNINTYSHYGGQCGGFLKKLKLDLPYTIKQSHSWAYIQRKP